MRRFVMTVCWAAWAITAFAVAGCGGDAPAPPGTGPTAKQLEKEGKPSGVPGKGK